MVQCPACGAYLTQEDVFCGECGYRITTTESNDAPESVQHIPPAPSADPPQALPSPQPAIQPSVNPQRLRLWAVAIAGAMVLCFVVFALGIFFLVDDDATPEPSDDPPSVGEILFSDDFSTVETGDWDVYDDDDTWADYVDGEYGLGVFRDEYVTWANPNRMTEFTDFEIDVDTRHVAGSLDNDFGVMVRYQPDDENFYLFEISSDGYYSVKLMRAGQWVNLITWTESEAIETGTGSQNHIKIVCQGNDFVFSVNDIYLDTVTDQAFPSGNIGLAAGTFSEPNVIIHFDNVQVRALE